MIKGLSGRGHVLNKAYLVLILCFLSLGLVACAGYTPNDHWVLEKSRIAEVPEVETYVMNLQETPDKRGFKVFTIAEGRKMVVISTGNAEISLALDNVQVDSGDTKVILKEIDSKNDENNPYIMVGISAIKGKLFAQDTAGNSFNEL